MFGGEEGMDMKKTVSQAWITVTETSGGGWHLGDDFDFNFCHVEVDFFS